MSNKIGKPLDCFKPHSQLELEGQPNAIATATGAGRQRWPIGWGGFYVQASCSSSGTNSSPGQPRDAKGHLLST